MPAKKSNIIPADNTTRPFMLTITQVVTISPNQINHENWFNVVVEKTVAMVCLPADKSL